MIRRGLRIVSGKDVMTFTLRAQVVLRQRLEMRRRVIV